MDSASIDYPIRVTDEFGELVMMHLTLTQQTVIKQAPLVARMARDLLEQAPAGMVRFEDDGSTLGRIRIVAANGQVLYRVDDWNPTTWHYVCVRLEHTDSDGRAHPAPRLERRELVPPTIGEA